MQLRRYLHLFRRQWYVVVLAIVATVGLAVALTPSGSLYQARAIIYVGSRSLDTGAASRDLTAERVVALSQLANTFALMIDSEEMASRAIDRTRADMLPSELVDQASAKQLTVGTSDTRLIAVEVTNKDPKLAQDLANGLADAFVDAVLEFEPNAASTEGSVPSLPAYIFERAREPTAPLPTALPANVAVAIIVGAAFSAAIILLLDYLNITVRHQSDVEHRLQLLVLANIPELDDRDMRLVVPKERQPTG